MEKNRRGGKGEESKEKVVRGEEEGIKGDGNDPRYSLTYMMKFRKHLYFLTRFSRSLTCPQ